MSLDRTRPAAWAALIACGAWLCWPALYPVHVEGFSAAIVALGIHLGQGTLPDFFPSQPINTEYFGLTKLGAVLGIAGLAKLGIPGETAMRLLMALGALLLAGGSARLVRHWTGAPWLLICSILLLIPGVAESSFFFNDNVLGAGLLVAALAIFCDRQRVAAALATGVLIGMAVAVRTDLVLVAPAILLMAWERQPLRRAAAATAIAAAASIVTLCLIYALVGASPLDAVRAGGAAVELWAKPGDAQKQFQSLLLFLGLPALVLCIFGVRTVLAAADWRRPVLLFGIPLLTNLALAGKIWEVRQLLVLTPFLAAVAVQGALVLVTDWNRGRRLAPAAIGAAMAAILLAPPALRYGSDGPRAMIGRAWAIRDWAEWQAGVRNNFALIDRVIAAAPRGRTLAVVTDYWDEDRYLHLRLVEQGFRAAAQPRPCDAIGQSMAKDGRTILQLSPHQAFLPNAEALHAPRLAELALPCLRALRPATVLVASADQVARLTQPADGAPIRRDTRLATAALSPAMLERLGRDHRIEASDDPPGRYRTVREALAATRARTRFGSD